jgi:hypothetical protein
MKDEIQSIDPNLIQKGRELTSGVEFDINEPLSRGEELIRELSDKAHDYACEQNELLGVSYRRTFERKFAELLIAEVIGIVNQQRVPSTLNYNPNQRTIEAIQLHFGSFVGWPYNHFSTKR